MIIADKRLQPMQEPIQVAHISFSLHTGGMERLLVEFAQRANQERYRLHFFCLTAGGKIVDEIKTLGWPVYQLGKPEGFKPNVVTQLAAEFRKQKISVVHTHNSGALIYGALASKLSPVQCVVHTRHGQRVGATRIQNLAFSGMSRLVDRVVGVSQDVSEMSIAEGVSQTKVRTISNGIDLSRFAFHGGNPDGPAITVARLAPEKDFLTLLRAVALVVQTHKEFRIDIVGDGPCHETILRQISDLGLQRHVRLLGQRHDVEQLLREASMFILSSHSEGISLTLLEAMASGLPVVASAVGGNVEVVEDGRTGVLVRPQDAPQMAEAIIRLLESRATGKAYGAESRKRMEDHFDVVRMIGEYERMYQDVMSEK